MVTSGKVGIKVNLTLAMANANELRNDVEVKKKKKTQKQVIIIVERKKVRRKQERKK